MNFCRYGRFLKISFPPKFIFMKRQILIFILFLIILFFINIQVVRAADTISKTEIKFTPQVGIGTEIKAGESMIIGGTSIAKYVVAIYNWALRVIVILAIVMIMVAGVRWMMAAGNASTVSQARDQIISSLIGLLIALGSYALLNFINPALVKLREIKPTGVENINIEFRKCADNQACVYGGQNSLNYCECETSTRVYFNPATGSIGRALANLLGEKVREHTVHFSSNTDCGEIIFSDKIRMGVKCPYGGDCVVNNTFYTAEKDLVISGMTSEGYYNSSAAYCTDLSLITKFTKCVEAETQTDCTMLNGNKYDICEFIGGRCLVKSRCDLIDATEKKLADKNVICCFVYRGGQWKYTYASVNNTKKTCEAVCGGNPQAEQKSLNDCKIALGF